MSPELQGKIKKYLLGRASESEREEVETAILTDDQAFEELEILESEVLDDYVGGSLPADERDELKNNFLQIGDRQEELKFSRALHRYVNSNASVPTATPPQVTTFARQPWLPRAVAAFAVTIIVLGVVWFLVSRKEPATFVALNLTLTASNRGPGSATTSVKLPLNADALKLNLQLPAERASGYKVRLIGSTGEQDLKITESNGQSVTVIIPAAQVIRGAYALQLYQIRSNGSEERIPGSYFFSVE